MKFSDMDVDLMVYEKYKPWDEKKVRLDFLPWYLPEKKTHVKSTNVWWCVYISSYWLPNFKDVDRKINPEELSK